MRSLFVYLYLFFFITDLFVFTKSFIYLKVIKHAVEVDADSSRFPSDWLFHVRWGKKPGDVNGKYQEKVTQI